MENPVRASLPSGPRCFLELAFRGRQDARTGKSPCPTDARSHHPHLSPWVAEQSSVCGARSTSLPYFPPPPPPAQWTPGRAGDPSSATAAQATPPQQRGTLGASSHELCVPILLAPFVASCRICLGLSLSLSTSSTPCHTQPHLALAHEPRTHTRCANTDPLCTHSPHTDMLQTHAQRTETRCTQKHHAHSPSGHRHTVHTHAQLAHTLRIHAVLTRRAHSSHATLPDTNYTRRCLCGPRVHTPTPHAHAPFTRTGTLTARTRCADALCADEHTHSA